MPGNEPAVKPVPHTVMLRDEATQVTPRRAAATRPPFDAERGQDDGQGGSGLAPSREVMVAAATQAARAAVEAANDAAEAMKKVPLCAAVSVCLCLCVVYSIDCNLCRACVTVWGRVAGS